MGGKAQSERWPRFSVEDIHRFGGLLVGALITIHVATIAVDSFLPFSVLNLVVPFTSTYRPIWTGLGIAAAELLLALAITNHYRKRLPYSFWRKAHYLNFAVWTLASLHGVMSGTDRGVWWLAIIYGLCIAVRRHAPRLAVRRARLPLAAASPLAGVVTVVAVPLAHRRAAATTRRRSGTRSNVSEQLTGTVIRNGTNLTQIVSFVGTGERSHRSSLVRADLLVATQAAPEHVAPARVPAERGHLPRPVTNVGGTSFSGTCRMPNGEQPLRRTRAGTPTAQATA